MKVKNISSALVVLSLPNATPRFRQELAPGRTIPVNDETYQEMQFDEGIAILQREHYIEFIDDTTHKAIQSDDDTTPIVDADTIKAMLTKQDITAFARFIPTATQAEKETVVKLSISMGITNAAFVSLIKKYCNVDIIEAINREHQLEG